MKTCIPRRSPASRPRTGWEPVAHGDTRCRCRRIAIQASSSTASGPGGGTAPRQSLSIPRYQKSLKPVDRRSMAGRGCLTSAPSDRFVRLGGLPGPRWRPPAVGVAAERVPAAIDVGLRLTAVRPWSRTTLAVPDPGRPVAPRLRPSGGPRRPRPGRRRPRLKIGHSSHLRQPPQFRSRPGLSGQHAIVAAAPPDVHARAGDAEARIAKDCEDRPA